MIILEGFDGGGKSTFAKKLGYDVVHPGAPPKLAEEESHFFRQQLKVAGQALIYDRVTCISQQVYQDRLFDPWYMEPLAELINTPKCIVVYCRPPDENLLDFTRHTVAEHDDPDQMAMVRGKATHFIRSYDILMSKVPHLVYDYTNASATVDLIMGLRSMMNSKAVWQKTVDALNKSLIRS